MPLLPLEAEKMPAPAGVVSPVPVTGLSGGETKSLLFQAVNQPNQSGGIRGGISGVSHFKPLIYKAM